MDETSKKQMNECKKAIKKEINRILWKYGKVGGNTRLVKKIWWGRFLIKWMPCFEDYSEVDWIILKDFLKYYE